MKSKFHKETLKFIGTKLKPETADFLDVCILLCFEVVSIIQDTVAFEI